mgnify:CR=1 FL=1
MLRRCSWGTSGGGWTVVFQPAVNNYSTSTLDYTTNDPVLLSGASSVLMAFRNGTMGVTGNWATFAMPRAELDASTAPARASSSVERAALEGLVAPWIAVPHDPPRVRYQAPCLTDSPPA